MGVLAGLIMAQMPNISFNTALTGPLLKNSVERVNQFVSCYISFGRGRVVRNHKSYAVYRCKLRVSSVLLAFQHGG